VLLLDEPLGALDLKLRQQMQVELKQLQRDVGITFLFVTHDQEEALTMSDRIAVFNAGRIAQVGAAAEIYEHPRTEFVAGFVGTSTVLSGPAARSLLGRDGTFVVRPERIRLDAADGGRRRVPAPSPRWSTWARPPATSSTWSPARASPPASPTPKPAPRRPSSAAASASASASDPATSSPCTTEGFNHGTTSSGTPRRSPPPCSCSRACGTSSSSDSGSGTGRSGGSGFTPPKIAQLDKLGAGEGAVSILAWPGYAEDGSNDPKVDWVTPFEKQTGCKATVKTFGTSDEAVTLMKTGEYDVVSASGDASLRLIAGRDVAPVNTDLVPNYADIYAFLKNKPWNSVNGQMYGIPHGWGANLLMYRTDKVNPAPTSVGAVFDANSPYKGKVTAYDSPIYIADAACT
jgi:hypothetical protein